MGKARRAIAPLIALGLVSSGAGPAFAAFPGENGEIAFNTLDFGTRHNPFDTAEVWITTEGGSEAVTDRRWSSYMGSWSPDGTLLAISRDYRQERPGGGHQIQSDLVTFSPEVGGALRLTDTLNRWEYYPTWSPDGSMIAYSRTSAEGNGAIWIVDADGADPRRVTDPPGSKDDWQPTWSPDGSAIVFYRAGASDAELWSVAPDGSALTRLTNNDVGDYEPDWAPDGSRIVFTRFLEGANQIFTMAADGSDEQQLTFGDRQSFTPAYSPDGSMIVFARGRSFFSSTNLWTMTTAGTGRVRITDFGDGLAASEPAWQPLTT